MSADREGSISSLLAGLASAPREPEFWAILFEQIWPLVYAHNFRMLRGDGSLADDITFDVLLNFAEKFGPEVEPASKRSLRTFASTDQLFGYLLVACRNKRIDHLRSCSKLVEPPNEGFDSTAAPNPSPEELASVDEIIEKTIGTLKPADRLLAELLVAGYKPPEILAVTGRKWTSGALHTRLTRIRNKLAPLLSPRRDRKKS